MSRLTSLAHDASGTTHDLTLEFGYNPAHQIVETERSNAVYSYTAAANMNRVDTHNGLNQIDETDATGTPIAIPHDARGNITDDGPRTFTYNSENRLVHSGGPDNFWLHHDPLGRAFNFQAPSLHETPDWVGWTMVAEADQNANVRRRYVHGPGISSGLNLETQVFGESRPWFSTEVTDAAGIWGPVSNEALTWYEGTATDDRRWLIHDERGSVIGVADDAGNVTHVNTYDEYGVPENPLTGRFGYTGQAWIPQIGLYYYRNRMYHPELGRYMQPDPLGYQDGTNLYAYVSGDPINFSDRLGLCRKRWGMVRRTWYDPMADPSSSSPDEIEVLYTWWDDSLCHQMMALFGTGYSRYAYFGRPAGGGSGGRPASRTPPQRRPAHERQGHREFCSATTAMMDAGATMVAVGATITAAGAGATPFIPDGEVIGGITMLLGGIVIIPAGVARIVNRLAGQPCP